MSGRRVTPKPTIGWESSVRAREAWQGSTRARKACSGSGRAGATAHRHNHETGRNDDAVVVLRRETADSARRIACRNTVFRDMPLAGLERLMADVGLHELNLNALVGVATGQVVRGGSASAGKALQKPPTTRQAQQTYFTLMSSMYGHGTCLDYAVKCLALQLRSKLVDGVDNRSERLALYGKALLKVQEAINSHLWANTEVLCAVVILCTYEAMEGGERASAWAQHIFGLAKLIRTRGPSRFNNKLEMLILRPMIGWINYESLCYHKPSPLDHISWRPVLVLLAGYDSSELGQRYVELGALGARMIRVICDLDAAIQNRDIITHEEIDKLEARCRVVKSDLVRWRDDCQPYISASRSIQGLSPSQGDLRAEILSASCVLLSAACRCVGAVSPMRRFTEEMEAVRLAKHLREVRQTAEYDDIAGFHYDRRMAYCEAILLSTKTWLQGVHEWDITQHIGRESPPSSRLIEEYKYQAWRQCFPSDKHTN